MFGDHWRLRAEADFFFVPASKDFSPTDIASPTLLTAEALGLDIFNLSTADPVTGGIQKDIENNAKFFRMLYRQDQALVRLPH